MCHCLPLHLLANFIIKFHSYLVRKTTNSGSNNIRIIPYLFIEKYNTSQLQKLLFPSIVHYSRTIFCNNVTMDVEIICFAL